MNARYGEGWRAQLEASFERAGFAYNPPPDVVPNTMRALRLTELARERGLHERLHDRLMDAYWSEAQNIGDPEVLLALAVEAGLDEAEVAEVIAGDRYRDLVASSSAQAQAIGINAVPGFLLDRRLIVLGAQPRETFERAFEQLAGT